LPDRMLIDGFFFFTLILADDSEYTDFYVRPDVTVGLEGYDIKVSAFCAFQVGYRQKIFCSACFLNFIKGELIVIALNVFCSGDPERLLSLWGDRYCFFDFFSGSSCQPG